MGVHRRTKNPLPRAKTLRWIAALGGGALIAIVILAFAGLRLQSSVTIQPADGEGADGGLRFQAPPGLDETVAAKAEVAGNTPEGQLVLAARNGETELVRALLADDGLSPDAEESRNGHRPLHQAAQAGQEEVVEILLDAGAAVDAVDGAGLTALMRAAGSAAVPVGQQLLNAGAAVDARSPVGDTPLTQVVGGAFLRHLQAGSGGGNDDGPSPEDELQFARILFNEGADPNLHSDEGSPLKALAVAQRAALLRLFVEHGAQVDGDLELRILSGIPGPIGRLLRDALAGAPDSSEATGAR